MNAHDFDDDGQCSSCLAYANRRNDGGACVCERNGAEGCACSREDDSEGCNPTCEDCGLPASQHLDGKDIDMEPCTGCGTCRNCCHCGDTEVHPDTVALLRKAGEWATGGTLLADAITAARTWGSARFDVDEVSEWLDARCFEAAAATQLRDAGITATQAATRTSEGLGGYTDTLAYKLSNGDLSLDNVQKILAGMP